MRIGFDFDNTIVSYDKLFHTVACEQGVIPSLLPVSKQAVRDYLRQNNQEDIWTEMQGYVYGARMKEADAYPDALAVIQKLSAHGHELAIISHKTKHPYLGTAYDLHAAARDWIAYRLNCNEHCSIPEEHIFFELTKTDKITRIRNFGCDVFIDDLPEILLADDFPQQTQRFLFDPLASHAKAVLPGVQTLSSWLAIAECL